MWSVVPRLGRRCAWWPLAVVVALFVVAGIFGIPHEDSAIIYSYSSSLATTGTISYFPGGEVAEGATPFLWMVLLALAQRIGVDPHVAANLLNVFACFVIVHSARVVIGANQTSRFAAIFFLLVIATGATGSSQYGFSSFLFAALLIAAAAQLAVGRVWHAVVPGALACLVRPDGVVYVGAIALTCLALSIVPRRLQVTYAGRVRITQRSRIGMALIFGGVVLTIFLAYWFWRMKYFGNAFPLPYYVKAHRPMANGLKWCLEASFGDWAPFTRLGLAWLMVVGMGVVCWDRFAKRAHAPVFVYAAVSSLVVTLIGLAYLARIYLSQNIGFRFELTIFLLCLFWFSCTLTLYSSSMAKGRWLLVMSVALFAVATPLKEFGRGVGGSAWEAKHHNIRPLALLLREAAGDTAVRMVVTEAGRLTYYSGFETVDAWGLNTPRYRRLPLVDPADVHELQPDLIAMHGTKRHGGRLDYLCRELKKPGRRRNWSVMTRAMFTGAATAVSAYRAYAVPVWMSSGSTRTDLFLLRVDHPRYKQLEAVLLMRGAEWIGNAETLLANPKRCRAKLSRLRA